jgi:putative ABC transport system ATP-binding protein
MVCGSPLTNHVFPGDQGPGPVLSGEALEEELPQSAMLPSRSLLECVNLSREAPLRPGVFLLREINFEIKQGEVMAVVGPSGAGKSTLLRMLNRLDEPMGGTIRLDGQDTREIPPRELRRRVGIVMQRAYLFPGTVAENLGFGPAQRGKSLSDSQIESMLSGVGLNGYEGRDALTLSGGEAQRVAILRALANDPEVLLLDEPTSALDAAARESVEAAITSLIEMRRLTCIWVTHSHEQARSVAAHVLALEAGRVRAWGSPTEILRA